jgi:hypothetical protein
MYHVIMTWHHVCTHVMTTKDDDDDERRRRRRDDDDATTDAGERPRVTRGGVAFVGGDCVVVCLCLVPVGMFEAPRGM